jgi:agmatine/peptidylarginine deiminase
MLGDLDVRIHHYGFGDIWLRDTGPLFLQSAHGAAAAGFRFNFWGGKYDLPGDKGVADFIAAQSNLPLARHNWVLEGGAIDVDGTGLVVTTEQCVLNINRNPRMDRASRELGNTRLGIGQIPLPERHQPEIQLRLGFGDLPQQGYGHPAYSRRNARA